MHGGCPALAHNGLCIAFSGHQGNERPISWDEFFDAFEHERLAFLYRDQPAGQHTSFSCKLISRDASETPDPYSL